MPGLYVAGWAKRGPIGIIDATLRDSMETVRHISNHLNEDILPEKKTTVDEVLNLIPKGEKIVTYDDWMKIDSVEREVGSKTGKVREKILSKE